MTSFFSNPRTLSYFTWLSPFLSLLVILFRDPELNLIFEMAVDDIMKFIFVWALSNLPGEYLHIFLFSCPRETPGEL